ncbi:MAG: inorganic phosphate transporter [Planctomycetes bacterium]|nr:inorganic phosphate transporter [Planctomycetota bacterium]
MPEFSLLLWAVIITALIFDFVNGWNDSANSIATVVGTRVLSPLRAVLLAAALNLVGSFMGQAVAQTVAGSIVDPDLVSHTVLIAAMGGAIIWAAAMTMIGMPISGSHSLLGGFLGAAVAKAGIQVVFTGGVVTILAAMLISPILGFVVAGLLYKVIAALFAHRAPGPTGRLFGRLQLVSVSAMSLMHGANDAQKVMGIITLGLLLGGYQDTLDVPFWVVLACGAAISLGTALGGWKVIKTLGHGLSRLKPVDGFAAETGASLILLFVAKLGVPVSTTHTITGSILGVGATRGLGAVRWGLGQKILLAWIFTLPSTMALGGGLYWTLWAAGGLDHEPPAPWKAQIEQTPDGAIALQWPEVEGAESYSVYRYRRIDPAAEAKHLERRSKKKSYRFSKHVPKPERDALVAEGLSEARCIDTRADPTKHYIYRLRAVNAHGGSRLSEEFEYMAPEPEAAPPDEP